MLLLEKSFEQMQLLLPCSHNAQLRHVWNGKAKTLKTNISTLRACTHAPAHLLASWSYHGHGGCRLSSHSSMTGCVSAAYWLSILVTAMATVAPGSASTSGPYHLVQLQIVQTLGHTRSH